jgi:hypothetical protein
MNNNLFNEMISGFIEAKKYRAGKTAKFAYHVWLLSPSQ